SAQSDGQIESGRKTMNNEQDETTTSGDAASESKWGFKSGRSGMATETKIGLLLILVLLDAFGYVVYKKMDKHPSDGLATVGPNNKDPFELDEAPKPDGKGKSGKHHHENHDDGGF